MEVGMAVLAPPETPAVTFATCVNDGDVLIVVVTCPDDAMYGWAELSSKVSPVTLTLAQASTAEPFSHTYTLVTPMMLGS
jgi:hypothetical protein